MFRIAFPIVHITCAVAVHGFEPIFRRVGQEKVVDGREHQRISDRECDRYPLLH